MPREPQVLVFIGIKDHVVALDSQTGVEVWRTKLKGSDFVTVVWDGEAVLAANAGEAFRLDPRTGAMLWRNELKGFGRGIVSIASERSPMTAGADNAYAGQKRRQQQQAAASAAAAG